MEQEGAAKKAESPRRRARVIILNGWNIATMHRMTSVRSKDNGLELLIGGQVSHLW